MSISTEQVIANANTAVIDYESASLQPDAGLLSFGGFKFNRFSVEETKLAMEIPDLNFYVNLDLTEQFFLGFDIDKATGKWWRERNASQIAEVLKNPTSISKSLPEFFKWLMSNKPIVFCRRTHADYVWTNNACKLLKIKNPIGYNEILDVPTAIFQATGEIKGYIKTGMEFANHNALGDCQRDGLQLAFITDPNAKLTTEQIIER